jgi:hypothetical protein
MASNGLKLPAEKKQLEAARKKKKLLEAKSSINTNF